MALYDSFIHRLTTPDKNFVKIGIKELVEHIQEDLMCLLNSRKITIEIPNVLTEVNNSFVTYGILDINQVASQDGDRLKMIEESITAAILQHDSRLLAPKVTVTASKTDAFLLNIQIKATIQAQPEPINVTFDSGLCPLTQQIQNIDTTYEE